MRETSMNVLGSPLAGSGSFRTTKPPLHTTTNAAIIQRFLPVTTVLEPENEVVYRITTGKRKLGQ